MKEQQSENAEIRLESLLNKLTIAIDNLTETLKNMNNPAVVAIKSKWLNETEVMNVLNLTKRGMEELRKKNIIRTSTATGRNYKYYKTDVEDYLYDHSGIRKRNSYKKS